MGAVWNTKWGKRRVRENPPTLEEAFIAAESLTDDFGQRIEIAASLMGVPVDEVKAQAAKFAPHPTGVPRSSPAAGAPLLSNTSGRA